MDNRAIAQVLGEIADLLEIKGENAFKIRAYRSASETIAAWPDGDYGFTDYIDGDGFSPTPIRIVCRITVKGSSTTSMDS